MPNKRILFIIDSLGIGGAEKSLLSLLALLNQQKYHVDLWIRQRGGELEGTVPVGVEEVAAPAYSPIERLLHHIALLHYSVTYRLQKLFSRQHHLAETLWRCTGWATKIPNKDYDVAIAYQQGMPTYLLAEKIHARKKIAWVNTNMVAAGYDMDYNRQFYAKADHIVTVSKELMKFVCTSYPQLAKKTECVYDTISPALILQQSDVITPPPTLRNGEDLLLVTVGRIATPKNYPLAIEAARLLRDKGLSFRWYIVGDGPERTYIERLIAEQHLQQQVTLLGALPNPYPYMRQCDIYVQTSSFEGFGLTIAEAKILGKPVVSTCFDVVHDQLRHGHNGLIADMTAESVAENILRLVNDEGLRRQIIRNVEAEKNTTAETEIKKVERLLDED